MAINHLQYSEYLARWKQLTNKELREQQEVLIDKINALSPESESIKTSLETVLELLEKYMEERGI